MTFKTAALLGATLLLIAPLAACSASAAGASPYGAGDPATTASNLGGGPADPFLANGQAVLRALDAISARSGKPFRVTSMEADRINGLTVNVQEPTKHVNVDRYVVAPDGTLSGPTPVKMMALGDGPVTAADVDRQTFDPKSIGFARLERTVREAIAKSTFDDARVTNWEIGGAGPDDRKFVYLEAARGRPVAIVDNHLKIMKIQF